jgi:hypothetical protein
MGNCDIMSHWKLIKPRFWTLSIVSGYENTTFRELAMHIHSPVREASYF